MRISHPHDNFLSPTSCERETAAKTSGRYVKLSLASSSESSM